MKTIIKSLTVLLAITALHACDGKINEFKETPVKEVVLDETISSGIELELGSKLDLTKLITVLPIQAQDRAEFFASSDESVASVSDFGIVEALKTGTTTITVIVAGIDKSFVITVVPAKVTSVQSISVLSDIVLWVGETADVLTKLSIVPSDATKDISVSMSANSTAEMEGTMVKALAKGEATVVVSSISDPSISAEIKVKVPTGDYSREGWSVVASSDVEDWKNHSTKENNSLTAPIDGNLETIFCQIRPGKTYAGMTNTTNELWFYLDLGVSTEVNYFRIVWKLEAGELPCRIFMFDNVQGSDDASAWTNITADVYTEAEKDAQNSPVLYIPKTKYRYYKFNYASTKSYTNPETSTAKNSSSQINEIYLGLNEYNQVEVLPVESFTFDSSLRDGVSLSLGEKLELEGKYTVAPTDATAKTVSFTSSDEAVATVSEAGTIEALAVGTSTITGTIDGKSDSFVLTVRSNDYDRTGWTVVASSDVEDWKNHSTKENNSLKALIDGNLSSIFCQIRPGKSYSGMSNTTSDVWFYLDLGEAKEVDCFRLTWRYYNKELFCRVYMFDEILGSNDATNWTSIATNVYTKAEQADQNSPLIDLPKTKYRYYKFDYHTEQSYTNPSTAEVKGGSSQIAEIYLGLSN